MTSLFDQIGGRAVLEKVHKEFYDDLYRHRWLKNFFSGLPQEVIEKQQTDFMSGAFGGPNVYMGKAPRDAHVHIFVTSRMLELRTELLHKAILKFGVAEELAKKWIKIDERFHESITKTSPSELKCRYPTQELKMYPEPVESQN